MQGIQWSPKPQVAYRIVIDLLIEIDLTYLGLVNLKMLYISCDSNSMTFWKRQNYGDGKRSVVGGWERGGAEDF